MIIQSGNQPIILTFADNIGTQPLRAKLWSSSGTVLKSWDESTAEIDGKTLTLNLTQEETAGFPGGLAYLDVKGLDIDGDTWFIETIEVYIQNHFDKEIMEADDGS